MFPLGSFGLTDEQVDEEHIDLISQLLGEDGHVSESFVRHLTDRLPPDFGAENIQNLASFLWSTLHQDPQLRVTTSTLLNHPFLFETESWGRGDEG